MNKKSLKTLRKKVLIYDLASFKRNPEIKKEPPPKEGSLAYLRLTLSPEDYIHFLEALVDLDVYREADEEIKEMVTCFSGVIVKA